MGHLAVMNTWGFVNSFGVFQTYYVTSLHESPSTISWIGTVQIFLLFFIGTFTGRLTDAGYFRAVFLTGSILSVFGLFMASLSKTYWQLFLAQGLCCGLGNGFIFCPAVSLLSTYFSKRRGLAIGLAATGSATGGMVFPAMVRQLLPRVGFPWTMRSLAFIDLACLMVCNLLMKTRVPPRRTGAMVDWKSFKETTYTLFAAGMFFVSRSCIGSEEMLTMRRCSGAIISHTSTSDPLHGRLSAFRTLNPSIFSLSSTAWELSAA